MLFTLVRVDRRDEAGLFDRGVIIGDLGRYFVASDPVTARPGFDDVDVIGGGAVSGCDTAIRCA